jgi:hypothetical protein
MRRPRTEARPRRADNAKGLTNQGPLQKGGQSVACPPSRANARWWARRKGAFAHPTLRFRQLNFLSHCSKKRLKGRNSPTNPKKPPQGAIK